MSGCRAALLCLFVAAGCAGGKEPPQPAKSSLPPGVLARVGEDQVGATTVLRLYESRGLTPDAAARLATDDAVWAQGARGQLPHATSRTVERAAVARAVLEELARAATSEGPPTSAEIDGLVQERWLELARPAAARTTHVVVINDKPERDIAARELATKLASALKDVPSSAELLRIGKAFPNEGFELKAESLPFVTLDGRTYQRQGDEYYALQGAFDLDFARAALALQTPGQLSPVAKSKFGYHVIRLDERDAGATIPAAELPALLAPELISRRAAKARQDLVQRLRQRSSIQIERAADDLTAKVQLHP